MNRLLATLAGVVAASLTLPAFAGPDWQTIEQARKNKRTQAAQTAKLTPQDQCAAMRLVLPLDHGPRAQSTPYLNEKRRQRFEADLKACKDAAAKGITQ